MGRRFRNPANKIPQFRVLSSTASLLPSPSHLSSMLRASLLCLLCLIFLTGGLAAENYYSLLGGERSSLPFSALSTSTGSDEPIVRKDASEADIKKAYRVRSSCTCEQLILRRGRRNCPKSITPISTRTRLHTKSSLRYPKVCQPASLKSG